ncbi:MAG TPA: hypothetical protein VFV32_00075 [Acidimicrobiales bacterium]|nr:hypothetical protein [Acidimicrobiales bacterium]
MARTRRGQERTAELATVVPLPGLGATHSELVQEASITRWTKVHGHDVAYRQAGTGPLLVMIHGIAGSSSTWVPVRRSASCSSAAAASARRFRPSCGP